MAFEPLTGALDAFQSNPLNPLGDTGVKSSVLDAFGAPQSSTGTFEKIGAPKIVVGPSPLTDVGDVAPTIDIDPPKSRLIPLKSKSRLIPLGKSRLIPLDEPSFSLPSPVEGVLQGIGAGPLGPTAAEAPTTAARQPFGGFIGTLAEKNLGIQPPLVEPSKPLFVDSQGKPVSPIAVGTRAIMNTTITNRNNNLAASLRILEDLDTSLPVVEGEDPIDRNDRILDEMSKRMRQRGIDIASEKGTIGQLDTLMAVGIGSGLLTTPAATAKMLTLFTGAETILEETGVNEKLRSIENAFLRDAVDIFKFGLIGTIAGGVSKRINVRSLVNKAIAKVKSPKKIKDRIINEVNKFLEDLRADREPTTEFGRELKAQMEAKAAIPFTPEGKVGGQAEFATQQADIIRQNQAAKKSRLEPIKISTQEKKNIIERGAEKERARLQEALEPSKEQEVGRGIRKDRPFTKEGREKGEVAFGREQQEIAAKNRAAQQQRKQEASKVSKQEKKNILERAAEKERARLQESIRAGKGGDVGRGRVKEVPFTPFDKQAGQVAKKRIATEADRARREKLQAAKKLEEKVAPFKGQAVDRPGLPTDRPFTPFEGEVTGEAAKLALEQPKGRATAKEVREATGEQQQFPFITKTGKIRKPTKKTPEKITKEVLEDANFGEGRVEAELKDVKAGKPTENARKAAQGQAVIGGELRPVTDSVLKTRLDSLAKAEKEVLDINAKIKATGKEKFTADEVNKLVGGADNPGRTKGQLLDAGQRLIESNKKFADSLKRQNERHNASVNIIEQGAGKKVIKKTKSVVEVKVKVKKTDVQKLEEVIARKRATGDPTTKSIKADEAKLKRLKAKRSLKDQLKDIKEITKPGTELQTGGLKGKGGKKSRAARERLFQDFKDSVSKTFREFLTENKGRLNLKDKDIDTIVRQSRDLDLARKETLRTEARKAKTEEDFVRDNLDRDRKTISGGKAAELEEEFPDLTDTAVQLAKDKKGLKAAKLNERLADRRGDKKAADKASDVVEQFEQNIDRNPLSLHQREIDATKEEFSNFEDQLEKLVPDLHKRGSGRSRDKQRQFENDAVNEEIRSIIKAGKKGKIDTDRIEEIKQLKNKKFTAELKLESLEARSPSFASEARAREDRLLNAQRDEIGDLRADLADNATALARARIKGDRELVEALETVDRRLGVQLEAAEARFESNRDTLSGRDTRTRRGTIAFEAKIDEVSVETIIKERRKTLDEKFKEGRIKEKEFNEVLDDLNEISTDAAELRGIFKDAKRLKRTEKAQKKDTEAIVGKKNVIEAAATEKLNVANLVKDVATVLTDFKARGLGTGLGGGKQGPKGKKAAARIREEHIPAVIRLAAEQGKSLRQYLEGRGMSQEGIRLIEKMAGRLPQQQKAETEIDDTLGSINLTEQARKGIVDPITAGDLKIASGENPAILRKTRVTRAMREQGFDDPAAHRIAEEIIQLPPESSAAIGNIVLARAGAFFEKVLNVDKVPELQLREELLTVAHDISAMSAFSGRLQESFKKPFGPDTYIEGIRQIEQLKNLTPEEVAAIKVIKDRVRKAPGRIRQMYDVVHELAISGMLSANITFQRNLFGAATEATHAAPDLFNAAVMTRIIPKKWRANSRYFRELIPFVKAVFKGIPSGIRTGADIFMHETTTGTLNSIQKRLEVLSKKSSELPRGEERIKIWKEMRRLVKRKMDVRKSVPFDRRDEILSGNDLRRRTPGLIGKILTTPLRMLVGTDKAISDPLFKGFKAAEIIREGIETNKTVGDINKVELTKAQSERALDATLIYLYRRHLGEKAGKIIDIVRDTPFLNQLFLFLRTRTSMVISGVFEHSPFGFIEAIRSSAVKTAHTFPAPGSKSTKKGKLQIDTVKFGKALTGTAGAIMLHALAKQTDTEFHSAAKNSREREIRRESKLPVGTYMKFKNGNVRDISNLIPFTFYGAFEAAIQDAERSKKRGVSIGPAMQDAIAGYYNSITENAIMSDLKTINRLLEAGFSRGTTTEGGALPLSTAARKALNNFVVGRIPAVGGAIREARQTGTIFRVTPQLFAPDKNIYDTETLAETFSAQTGLGARGLEIRKQALGYAASRIVEGGPLNPFAWRGVDTRKEMPPRVEAVIKASREVNAYILRPQTSSNGVKFNLAEQRELIDITAGGKVTMGDTLKELVGEKVFEDSLLDAVFDNLKGVSFKKGDPQSFQEQQAIITGTQRKYLSAAYFVVRNAAIDRLLKSRNGRQELWDIMFKETNEVFDEKILRDFVVPSLRGQEP